MVQKLENILNIIEANKGAFEAVIEARNAMASPDLTEEERMVRIRKHTELSQEQEEVRRVISMQLRELDDNELSEAEQEIINRFGNPIADSLFTRGGYSGGLSPR